MKEYVLIVESNPEDFEVKINRYSAKGYEIYSFTVDASAASRYTALMYKHTFDSTAKPWGVI